MKGPSSYDISAVLGQLEAAIPVAGHHPQGDRNVKLVCPPRWWWVLFEHAPTVRPERRILAYLPSWLDHDVVNSVGEALDARGLPVDLGCWPRRNNRYACGGMVVQLLDYSRRFAAPTEPRETGS